MKQSLLLLLLFIGSLGYSQLTFDKSSYETEFDAETLVKVDLYLSNSSTEDVEFIWKLDVVDQPEGWNFFFCDLIKCHAPGVASIDASNLNTLSIGQTSLVYFDAMTNGICGTGKYHLTLMDPYDEEIILLETDITVFCSPTANKETEILSAYLYPNPVQSYFNIDGDSNLVSEVAVYNVLGKNVKSFSKSANNEYYVGDLMNGRYFVRLIDNNGKSLQVLRLLKQGI